MPDNKKTVMCMRKANCTYGERCLFAHSFRELQVRHVHKNFKTVACRHGARCRYEENCRLRHGEVEEGPCASCGVSVLVRDDQPVAIVSRCLQGPYSQKKHLECNAKITSCGCLTRHRFAKEEKEGVGADGIWRHYQCITEDSESCCLDRFWRQMTLCTDTERTQQFHHEAWCAAKATPATWSAREITLQFADQAVCPLVLPEPCPPSPTNDCCLAAFWLRLVQLPVSEQHWYLEKVTLDAQNWFGDTEW